MKTFIAVYRGATVAESRLVAVSAEPELVRDVTARLLDSSPGAMPDPVVAALEHGRRAALQLISDEPDDE